MYGWEVVVWAEEELGHVFPWLAVKCVSSWRALALVLAVWCSSCVELLSGGLNLCGSSYCKPFQFLLCIRNWFGYFIVWLLLICAFLSVLSWDVCSALCCPRETESVLRVLLLLCSVAEFPAVRSVTESVFGLSIPFCWCNRVQQMCGLVHWVDLVFLLLWLGASPLCLRILVWLPWRCMYMLRALL